MRKEAGELARRAKAMTKVAKALPDASHKARALEGQADELKEAYAPYIALEVSDSEDGWSLMTGRKPA